MYQTPGFASSVFCSSTDGSILANMAEGLEKYGGKVPSFRSFRNPCFLAVRRPNYLSCISLISELEQSPLAFVVHRKTSETLEAKYLRGVVQALGNSFLKWQKLAFMLSKCRLII